MKNEYGVSPEDIKIGSRVATRGSRYFNECTEIVDGMYKLSIGEHSFEIIPLEDVMAVYTPEPAEPRKENPHFDGCCPAGH